MSVQPQLARNKGLQHHIAVVLSQQDDVLYKNRNFTQSLTTDDDDSLFIKRTEHIQHLEKDIHENEKNCLRAKIARVANFKDIDPVDSRGDQSLICRLMCDYEGLEWDTQFNKNFQKPLSNFVDIVLEKCNPYFRELLQDTSLAQNSETMDRVSSVDDVPVDTISKSDELTPLQLFDTVRHTQDVQPWSQRTLPVYLGLILYRTLCQKGYSSKGQRFDPETESHAVAARFQNMFFELPGSVADFFRRIWILDEVTNTQSNNEKINDLVQECKAVIHTYHLQGTLSVYFSPKQLERVFAVTRGPYVSLPVK